MLKIFKNYTWKTSLFDDFMYYENRQKIMQEEKTRLRIKSYGSSFLIPALDPPRKQNFLFDLSSTEEEKTTKSCELHSLEKSCNSQLHSLEKSRDSVTGQVSLCSDFSNLSMAKENANCTMDEAKDNEDKDDLSSSVHIGSLTINPKQFESKPSETSSMVEAMADTKTVDVVTVGSMAITINGYADSPGFLTVGTISIDPRSLHLDEAIVTKTGS
ncbi:YT521-B-like domain [Sarracenia purpurea var. burkii]